MTSVFYDAFDFIDAALRQGDKVLVHCSQVRQGIWAHAKHLQRQSAVSECRRQLHRAITHRPCCPRQPRILTALRAVKHSYPITPPIDNSRHTGALRAYPCAYDMVCVCVCVCVCAGCIKECHNRHRVHHLAHEGQLRPGVPSCQGKARHREPQHRLSVSAAAVAKTAESCTYPVTHVQDGAALPTRTAVLGEYTQTHAHAISCADAGTRAHARPALASWTSRRPPSSANLCVNVYVCVCVCEDPQAGHTAQGV